MLLVFGIRVKNRGVRFHRIQDFKQYLSRGSPQKCCREPTNMSIPNMKLAVRTAWARLTSVRSPPPSALSLRRACYGRQTTCEHTQRDAFPLMSRSLGLCVSVAAAIMHRPTLGTCACVMDPQERIRLSRRLQNTRVELHARRGGRLLRIVDPGGVDFRSPLRKTGRSPGQAGIVSHPAWAESTFALF